MMDELSVQVSSSSMDGNAVSRSTDAKTTATMTMMTSDQSAVIVGKPREQFEVRDVGADEDGLASTLTQVPATTAEAEAGVDEMVYPAGAKLWLNMASMLLCALLRGLDLTIVGVAIPSITNEFRTVQDIGWYTAANGIVISSTCFFFGKIYSVFDVKRTYLLSIVVFWLGAIVCTFAPSSRLFIFGRAVVSLGAAWQGGGVMTQFNSSFPLHKRPVAMGVLMFTQTLAMVAAPIIGGALIREFGWRACFGINIPLNFIALIFTAYAMQNPKFNPDVNLSLWEKVKRLDLGGTAIFVPALTCLLVALQWGGVKYGWSDGRIIALLVVYFLLVGVFAFLQHRLQDRAVLPPRILKRRSILAGAWFNACCDGVLATVETYMSIYFQGVRGLSPVKAGVLAVPMIVGLAAATLASGTGISIIGYYSPFMIFTSVIAPIAIGLLTTLDLDSQLGKAAGLLGILGFAVGLGMQGPMMAVSASLKDNDVAIGSAILTFSGGMGSALFVSTAAVLFQNRLDVEVSKHAPGVNATAIEMAGLSDIRSVIGQDRLKDALTGYDKATIQTLYIPLVLACASIVGSSLTEWRSVKQKKS